MKYLSIILIFCFCSSSFSLKKEEPQNDYEIFWQENRPLTWIDFQGYPKYRSEFSAVTVSSIKQTINCDENDNFIFEVAALFNAYKSWTRTNKRNVLLHEQKHFDLTEVYARKIRKAYFSIQNPCDYELEDLAKIYEVLMEELQIIQTQYDKETDHGNIKDAQFFWNQKIADLLIEHQAYASKQ